VSDLDDQIARVRDRFDTFLVAARAALMSGKQPTRVQGHYLVAAFEIMEAAEADAVLAAAGDVDALRSLPAHTTALAELTLAMGAELRG